MADTIVYLLRHGEVVNPKETIYARSNEIHLSEKGVMQIKDVGKLLLERNEKPGIIYSSPLTRTRESAVILSDTLGNVSVTYLDDLLEVSSRGLEETLISDAMKMEDLYENPPQGAWLESPEAIVTRMLHVLTMVKQQHQGGISVLVSHGDPIAFLLWRLKHPDGLLPSSRVLLSNEYPKKGSVCRIVFAEDGTYKSADFISSQP